MIDIVGVDMGTLNASYAAVFHAPDSRLFRLRRRLDRIEAGMGLTALVLIGSGLFVVGLLALAVLTHLLLYLDFGREMLVVVSILSIVVPLIIIEYRTIKVYDDVYRLAVYPTSLAVGVSQTHGRSAVRIIRGTWWLLHACILLAGVGTIVGKSFAALFDNGLEIIIIETIIKFCLAVGIVYACNTLVLCTVACWSASERVVLGMWRVRILLTTALGLAIGVVRFSVWFW